MRRILLTALLLLPTAAAAGVLQDLGIERSDAESALLSLVLYGGGGTPPGVEAGKALPPAQRAAAVKALGALAKEIFASASFKQQYAQERKSQLPPEPVPPRDAKKMAAERKAEMDKGFREAEEALKQLPKEQQAELRRMMEEARALQPSAEAAFSPELLAQEEAHRFQMEKEAYAQAQKERPAEPAGALKLQLRKLLELTDGVDYGAKTFEEDGRRFFSETRYERKPNEWKMCFRAGKETCEAARAFAKSWIAELK